MRSNNIAAAIEEFLAPVPSMSGSRRSGTPKSSRSSARTRTSTSGQGFSGASVWLELPASQAQPRRVAARRSPAADYRTFPARGRGTLDGRTREARFLRADVQLRTSAAISPWWRPVVSSAGSALYPTRDRPLPAITDGSNCAARSSGNASGIVVTVGLPSLV